MRVRQARSRPTGLDTHVIQILPDNDPSLFFTVRRSTLDGSLVPVTETENEKAVFVLIDVRDNSKKEVAGTEVEAGIWQFDLRSTDVSIAHEWRVDSIHDGRRTTHALGSFVYER